MIFSQKLHLSSAEQNVLESFKRIQADFKNLPAAPLSLEIEKKPQLIEVLSYLVSQAEFDSEKLLQALAILKAQPKALVSGEPLKDLIAPRLIKKALDEVRLKQFEGVIKTRQEALDYIKNHFARST